MSTDSTGSVSSEDADNTVFWTDMDTVLREKEQDALQDNLYAEQESQREAEQYQQIMNNILEPSANGSGVLDILDTNPPSPINLSSGTSAPSTTNSASKMNNKLNSV